MRRFGGLFAATLLLVCSAAAAQQLGAPAGYAGNGHAHFDSPYPPVGNHTYQNVFPANGPQNNPLYAPPAASTYPASYMQPPEQTDSIGTDPSEKPPKQRGPSGPHQGDRLTATWLAGDDLGLTDIEYRSVWAFPFPTQESPLIITPGFGVHFLDGPGAPDLPPRLYDGYLQFRWMRQITPRLGADISVTPGIYSDFERRRDESIRVAGRAISMFEWSPALKFALGVVYLDRNDVGLLPAAGLIWTPNADMRLELVFPRPRVAFRYPSGCGDDACENETWYYLAGEFGGGSWAIQRAGGADDEVTYRDYRLVCGIEHKTAHNHSSKLEIAYVFGRELEYLSPTPDFQPDDTVMIRVTWGI